MKNISFKNTLFLIAYTMLLLVSVIHIDKLLGVVLYFAKIITPFFIALCIAFIINIPLKKIEPHLSKKIKPKLRRSLSIFLSFLFVILFFTVILTFLIPQISDSIQTLKVILPDYITKTELFFSNIALRFNIPKDLWSEFLNQFNEILSFFGSFMITAAPKVLSFTMGIANGTINFFIGLVVSFYLLSSKENLLYGLSRSLKAIFPKKTYNYLLHVGEISNNIFSSFIAGQLTESLILGTLCTIGLFILRIDYAILIGVIVGISSLIPIFGSIIGTIPCAFILFVINPKNALIFLVFIFILQQLEGDIIYPRVVGKSIGISGLWVMFAMVVGGSLLGVFGLIIGIPIFAVFYTLFQEWVDNRLS